MMRWPVCAPASMAANSAVFGRPARTGGWPSTASFPSPICSMPWPQAAEAKTMLYDVVIVGAGPAGSAAARLLAEVGWSVALVEKSEFPRRKVCGEFISATSLAVLKACGVMAPFIAAAGPPVMRVGVYAGNAMLSAPREQVWGRALGREHLDVMLRDAAVAAGAELFQPVEVTGLTREADGFVCVLEDGREIAARIVIGACGSWNAKGLFVVPQAAARPSDLFAFKAHFPHRRLPAGLMPLLAFPGGYGGLGR